MKRIVIAVVVSAISITTAFIVRHTFSSSTSTPTTSCLLGGREFGGYQCPTSAGGDPAGAAAQSSAATTPTIGLSQAVNDTLSAPSYTEVVSQESPQGTQTYHLVFRAPDRLGGYIESGNKRSYVYILGSEEYQSLTVGASTNPSVLYKQAAQSLATLNPANKILGYSEQGGNATLQGNTYSFALSQGDQVGNFAFTVKGKYVASAAVVVAGAAQHIEITQIGTSPPVSLPSGAKIVGTSTGG